MSAPLFAALSSSASWACACANVSTVIDASPLVFRYGDGEREPAAFTELAFDADAAAHLLDEVRGDGIAQPGPRLRARVFVVSAPEFRAELLNCRRRHADAGVADAELNRAV